MDAAAPVAHAPGRRQAVFGALRHRDYRFYWTGQVLSVFGQTMEFVALGWLVYEITGSALSLGLTGLAQALPRISLALVGGAVADRVDRRRLLITTQGLTAVLYFILATLVVTGIVTIWHVIAIALLLGGVRSFDSPNRQAIVPHLVGREELPSAIALGNLAWDIPRLVGPSSAGLLILLIGTGQTFYVATFGYFAAMVFFSLVRSRIPRGAKTGKSLLQTMLEGVGFIRQNELFYALIGLVFFNSIFGMSYQLLLPAFAREVLHVDSSGLGLAYTCGAIGAMGGSLSAAFLAHARRRGLVVVAGATAFGSLIVAFALSPWFLLSLGLLLSMGFASSLYMTSIATILQISVPDEFRARVMSVWSLTWSLPPLGSAISGTVAEYAGIQTAIALGGTLVAALAIAVGAGIPRVRRAE